MTHAEKLEQIEKFNELAQNGEWEQAIDMVISDFDISLFNLSSRKKFVQYCKDNVTEDNDISNKNKVVIFKSIESLRVVTDKLLGVPIAEEKINSLHSFIRMGYGITDFSRDKIDFFSSIDFAKNEYSYNKFVGVFFNKMNFSHPEINWYITKIMDSAGRHRYNISLENSKKLLDIGFSESYPFNMEGLFSIDKSLINRTTKIVLDKKNTDLANYLFTACCERNNREYIVSLLDNGFKSITNGILIAINSNHFGLATLILKYKPRKFSLSMVQWLMDRYHTIARRYSERIIAIMDKYAKYGVSTIKSYAEEATRHANLSVDVINCIQYALDKKPDESCLSYIKTVANDASHYLDKIKNIGSEIESYNIPAFRCFDNDLRQMDSYQSNVAC